MKESSTYQAILEEGRTEGLAKGLAKGLIEGRAEGAIAEAKKVLRRLGDAAFGPPDTVTVALIEHSADLTRLEEMLERVRTATNWQELLGQAPPRRRSGRRPPP